MTAQAGLGQEMGRAGGKEVVCPYGQRQVAAIALRAPCSGIKIKDDKQTNKLYRSVKTRHAKVVVTTAARKTAGGKG